MADQWARLEEPSTHATSRSTVVLQYRMATPVNQRQLRNDSGAIMRRVEQGERFIVTRNGVPVADLIPHQSGREAARRFVAIADIAAGLATVPDWDTARFADELTHLDSAVDDRDVDTWHPRT